MQFKDLGLSDEILSAVKLMGFKEMTEIQEKSIPVILNGSDVIGRSNTGTGKTAAFGIPVIEQITKDDSYNIQTLILCPTRELAQQACDEIKKFSKFKNWVKPLAIFGGVNIDKQIYQLKHGANIIIGTPGRIIDHINRRTLKLNNLKTIVLDEADEMLQMGFREDIENILQHIPENRQTILFSATMPPEILAITNKYQNNPTLIKTLSKSKTVETIDQFYYIVPLGKKFEALDLLLIKNQPKSSMIFCNTKKMVDELTDMLISKGYKAVGIHGDMKQSQRTSVMNSFKSGKTSILVATDVAARGIDINGVDAVFNYDLPQDNEYYIHRIGRTGRAGKSGSAYTLVCNRNQVCDLNVIARNTNSVIKESELPSRSELVEAEIQKFTDSFSELGTQKLFNESYELMNNLLSNGWTYEKTALYLINNMLADKLRDIPDVKVIKYRNNDYDYKRTDKKTAKVNINIGRNHKISPNFILGALVDATGISGKNFGKIDIHENFTNVDVPVNKIDYIVNSMKNSKIKGNRVIVKKADIKANYRQSGKKNNNKNKRNISQRYKKKG